MTGTPAAVWLKEVGRAAAGLWSRRAVLLRIFSLADRYQFSCRVARVADESQPVGQDRFFRVQMTGRILTPQDNCEITIQIEIQDITAGRSAPLHVLSADGHYRAAQTAVFYFRTSSEIVPHKNAILAGWADVERIPCHVLRFAYRGRRKLLFRVSVLSAATGQTLVSGHQVIEHVSCYDGYQELWGRRLDVLCSCVELAVIVARFGTPSDTLTDRLTGWFEQRASIFMAEGDAQKKVESILTRSYELTPQTSCQPILAFGENADRLGAIELAIQVAAMTNQVSKAAFAVLSQIAAILEIQEDRFLALAQKILLSAGCCIEDPFQLLGISESMDDAAFRKRLNEEYRKWNARVTHPDDDIRRQADRMLILISELRSRRLQPCQ
jgi:hypothetical protein